MDDRLLPEVASFVRPHFSLRRDLESLLSSRRAGAAEGAIFYGARILEALTACGVADAGEIPHDHVFSNIETLRHFQLMSGATSSFAHALRRLGNDVRHLRREVTLGDVDMALIFAGWCLEWYFCAFPLGPGLVSATRDGQAPLPLGVHEPTRALLQRLEHLDHGASLLALLDEHAPTLLASPAATAVVAERLIDLGATDAAFGILRSAREKSANDLRIQQLLALCHSRTGELETATEILEGLLALVPDDEETQGILAGTLKRIWNDKQENEPSLVRAFHLYRNGWRKLSRRTNPYLGINAGAVALWLGKRGESKTLAGEVLTLLDQRSTRVKQWLSAQRDHAGPGSHWEDLTRAEAELLLENFEESRRLYVEAFRLYAQGSEAAIAVARKQIERNLAALEYPGGIKAFLGRSE